MMQEKVNNINEIIKAVLTNEVKYILAIIAFVFGIVQPYYAIKEDISLIKQNHISHIEAIEKEILDINEKYLELKTKDQELQNTQLELMKNISALK